MIKPLSSSSDFFFFGHLISQTYLLIPVSKRQNKLDCLFLWKTDSFSSASAHLEMADISCVLKTWNCRPAPRVNVVTCTKSFFKYFFSTFGGFTDFFVISINSALLEEQDMNCPATFCYVCVCVWVCVYVRSFIMISAGRRGLMVSQEWGWLWSFTLPNCSDWQFSV